MLSDKEKELVVSSWRLVVPIAETAADLFYQRLFEIEPSYRLLFKKDMKSQKLKLLKMLSFVVKSLNWSGEQWQDAVPQEDDLFLVVLALGRRHASIYKIPADSYEHVGQALIWTLHQGLGDAFTDDIKAAWIRVYTLLAKTMLVAGEAKEISDVKLGLTRG